MAVDLQPLIVALIVTVALAYACWALMPAAWRRALRQHLTGRIQPEATGCGGCGGGCTPPAARSASAAAAATPEAKPITFHPRPR